MASTSASRLPSSMQIVRRSSAAPSVSTIRWKRALPEWALSPVAAQQHHAAATSRKKSFIAYSVF